MSWYSQLGYNYLDEHQVVKHGCSKRVHLNVYSVYNFKKHKNRMYESLKRFDNS